MVKLLTQREKEIISKKMKGLRMTQNESNILSKYIRPKLRELRKINPDMILKKLEYNQKAKAIENKVKRILLDNISGIDSITVCGSAVQTNYKEYNDIDVLVATKKAIPKRQNTKLIKKIEETAKKQNLNLDIQIYAKSSILDQYPHNPSLIYQLKDSKVIFGNLKIPKKIVLLNLDLKMKLDWSENIDMYSTGEEIYYAIRNAILVQLLMKKEIDNYKLRKTLIDILGADLIMKLKNNNATNLEKKLVLNYIKLFTSYLEKVLNESKWEKIEIEST